MADLPNRISKEELKRGDHIYSWRAKELYAHQGIYVADDMVIHFTSGETRLTRFIFCKSSSSVPGGDPCPRCGHHSRKPHALISSCIDCFLSGGGLCRYRYGVSKDFFFAQKKGGTCTIAPSGPPEDVVHRAYNLFCRNGFGAYHLFHNNCETFALYCKTGLVVESTGLHMYMSGQATAFIFDHLPGGIYIRYVSDIGVRRDVRKVSVERLVAGS